MPRVFISYVREDKELIDKLAADLASNAVEAWIDRRQLLPGYRWQDAIRRAIGEGDFFIACFSSAYNARSKTYMNEELILAIEELRKRSSDRVWFIPIRLSPCQIPDRSIGAGETVNSLQSVDLFDNWEEGISRILKVVCQKNESDCRVVASRSTFEGHSGSVNCVAAIGAHRFLSGSSDHTIRLWESDSQQCLRTFFGHIRAVSDLAIIPHSCNFASASWDNTLRIWDYNSGDSLHELKGHTRGVIAVAATADGKYLVSGSADFTVRVWRWEEDECTRVHSGFDHAITGIVSAPDGHYAITGCDNRVQKWDIHSGECLSTLEHPHNVSGVAVTHDGKHVISCLRNGEIWVWNLESESVIYRLLGHTDQVWHALVTPDCRYLATCSADGTARIWDSVTKSVVAEFRGHAASVGAICLAEDLRRLVTGSEDRSLRMWAIPPIPILLFSLASCRGSPCDTSGNNIQVSCSGQVLFDAQTGYFQLHGGYIDISRHPALDDLQCFGIEAAIIPYVFGNGRQNILEAQNPAVALAIDHEGRLAGAVNTAGGWFGFDSGKRRLVPGAPAHVCFSRDKEGRMQLKIDDEVVAKRRIVGPIERVDQQGFRIGAWTDGRTYKFTGRISALKVYGAPSM